MSHVKECWIQNPEQELRNTYNREKKPTESADRRKENMREIG